MTMNGGQRPQAHGDALFARRCCPAFVAAASAVGAALVTAFALAGCGGEAPGRPPAPPAAGDIATVPITTASEEARQLYVKGRELRENLRPAEARRYFENAVARDPDFALAHLGLAQAAASPQEFFPRLERAVALADRVSPGEQWLILGVEAGVKSNPAAQERYFRKLAETYPEDERVQTLLGGIYLFDRREAAQAIVHFRRAIEIAPDFPPAHNLLGYAYRDLGPPYYADAEAAFKRYIALVPGEPNPYDSYAELLMKTGRFEDSIANYRKALSIDDGFAPSYVGIGRDQALLGRTDEAIATYQNLYDRARDSGERRQALTGTAAVHLFAGDSAAALETVRRRADLAEEAGDLASLASDHALAGTILLEAGRPRDALAEFDQALEFLGRAAVSDEIKEAGRRDSLYVRSRLALAAGDLKAATAKLAAYRVAVERTETPEQLRRMHELAGRLALARGDAAAAAAELAEADQLDPEVLYLQALAARDSGDLAGAREFARAAAEYNSIDFSYALVRGRAKRLVAELE